MKVGISNHHVHLTKEHLNILFGSDYNLEIDHMLYQPKEFASKSYVTLIGPKDKIEHVRVLGPIRDYTQVEVSKTDCYKLGVDAPVRNSGDLLGSSPIKILGPNGIIDLKEGLIIASRHIHLTPKDVKDLDLEGVNKVKIKIKGIKGGILNNVYLKVSDDSKLECHLDTDDANGNLVNNLDEVEIIK